MDHFLSHFSINVLVHTTTRVGMSPLYQAYEYSIENILGPVPFGYSVRSFIGFTLNGT